MHGKKSDNEVNGIQPAAIHEVWGPSVRPSRITFQQEIDPREDRGVSVGVLFSGLSVRHPLVLGPY